MIQRWSHSNLASQLAAIRQGGTVLPHSFHPEFVERFEAMIDQEDGRIAQGRLGDLASALILVYQR